MKKFDEKFYLKLCCSVVLLGLFLFLINMPLHRVDSNDYNFMESRWYASHPDKISKKYYLDNFDRIYNKYDDKYVKANVLIETIRVSTDGKTKIKKIRELAKLDVSINYGVAHNIINVLNYYGHYDEAYDFTQKVMANYNPCHDFYSTVFNMVTCKISMLSKDNRQDEIKQKTTFENFSERIKDYSKTPIIDKNLVKMVPNILAHGNPGNWSDVNYAQFSYSMDKLSEAVFHLDRAVQDKHGGYYFSSEKYEIVRIYGIPVYYYIRFGEDYMTRGDYKKAVECFNKFLKHAPNLYSYSMNTNPFKTISYEEYTKGSYKLHKKMYDCYLKLGDKKSAEKHKKIMDEMLSW